MRAPYLAYSELTCHIYIVHGAEKYDVTKQAKRYAEIIKMIEEERAKDEQHNDSTVKG